MRRITPTLLSVSLVATMLPETASAAPVHPNAFDRPEAEQPGAKLEYDSANRLRRVKRGNLDIRYLYDALGNLEAEIVDDGVKVTRTDLMVDESGPLPRIVGALTDDGGKELYAYGPMGLAMVRKTAPGQVGGTTYHALTDELGTVRGLADGTGVLAGRIAYGPFGRVRATEGEQVKLAFAGEYRDTAGLIWLRARHYAPFLGRFLQRDTVVDDPGNPQTLNRYGYAANNPLSNLDPSGHFVEVAVVAATFLLITWCQAALAPSGDPNEPGLAEAQKHNSEIYQRTAIDGTLGAIAGPLANKAGSWAGRTLLTSGLADDAARGAYISANGGRIIMGPRGALGTVGASSARASRAEAVVAPLLDDAWRFVTGDLSQFDGGVSYYSGLPLPMGGKRPGKVPFQNLGDNPGDVVPSLRLPQPGDNPFEGIAPDLAPEIWELLEDTSAVRVFDPTDVRYQQAAARLAQRDPHPLVKDKDLLGWYSYDVKKNNRQNPLRFLIKETNGPREQFKWMIRDTH